MIDKISKFALKTEVDVDGKNALMLVTELLSGEGNKSKFAKLVEEQILKKTGQKKKQIVDPFPKNVVDKKTIQKLSHFRGFSCGFTFECLGSNIWQCIGENCNVTVSVNNDLVLADPHHYYR